MSSAATFGDNEVVSDESASLAEISRDGLVREVVRLREHVAVMTDTNTQLEAKMEKQRLRMRNLITACRKEVDDREKVIQCQQKQFERHIQEIMGNLFYFEGKLRKEQKQILEVLAEKERTIQFQQDNIRILTQRNEKLKNTLRKFKKRYDLNGIQRTKSTSSGDTSNSEKPNRGHAKHGMKDRTYSDSSLFVEDKNDFGARHRNYSGTMLSSNSDIGDNGGSGGEVAECGGKDLQSSLGSPGTDIFSPKSDGEVKLRERPRRRKSGLETITMPPTTQLCDQYRHFPHYSYGDLRLQQELKETSNILRANSASDLSKGAWTKNISGDSSLSVNQSENGIRSISAENIPMRKDSSGTQNGKDNDDSDYTDECHDSVAELTTHKRFHRHSYAMYPMVPITSHKNVQTPRDIKMRDKWRSRSLPSTVNMAFFNQLRQQNYHPPVNI